MIDTLGLHIDAYAPLMYLHFTRGNCLVCCPHDLLQDNDGSDFRRM